MKAYHYQAAIERNIDLLAEDDFANCLSFNKMPTMPLDI